MASVIPNRGKFLLSSGGSHTWATTGVGLLLVTGHTPDVDDNFVSDLVADEISQGYTRPSLSGQSRAEDDANDRVNFTASNVTLSSLASGDTPSHVVLYDSTNGTDAARELLAVLELLSAPAPNGGDYTLNWGSGSGILFYLG